MTETVNYELGKLLKEKGFDLPTNKYYEQALTSKKDSETNDFTGAFGWKKGETNLNIGFFRNNGGMADLSNENWYMCSAPTIAQVIMWLYEKQIDLCHIVNYKNNVRKYRMGIVYIKNNVIESTFIKDENTLDFVEFDSLTEAYLAGITHVLTNLNK